ANAVDDRRVVERVGDDGVLLAEERLEEAAVRVEARRVEDRVLHAEELRDRVLELLVDVLRAADEADAREAEAALVDLALRGGDHLGVRGEAEVVVRAEVEHLALGRAFTLASADRGALRRRDDALFLEETGFANL